jgi:peptidoglycan hydrolase-like protein with peptidoglycan-binding domain
MKKGWLALLVFLLATAASLRADQTTADVQRALKEQGFYYGDVTGRKSEDTMAAIRRYQIRNGLQVTGEIDAETLRSLGIGSGTSRTTPAPKSTPEPAPPAPPPATEPEEEEEVPTQSAEISPPPSYPQPGPPASDYGRGPSYPPSPSYGPGPATRPPRLSVDEVFSGTPYEMAPPDLQRHVVVGAQSLLARYGLYQSGIDGEFGPGTEAAVREFQARAGLVVNGRLNMATLGALGLLPGQRAPGFSPALRHRYYLGRPVYRGVWVPDR